MFIATSKVDSQEVMKNSEGMAAELPPFLTVDELAAVLRISRGSAYRMVKADPPQIEVVRIGRTIRIPRAALVRLYGRR